MSHVILNNVIFTEPNNQLNVFKTEGEVMHVKLV